MSSSVRTQKVGVIGATGAVGAEMIKVRTQRNVTHAARHGYGWCAS